MIFEDALRLLKERNKVRRSDWDSTFHPNAYLILRKEMVHGIEQQRYILKGRKTGDTSKESEEYLMDIADRISRRWIKI